MRIDHLAFRVKDRNKTANFFKDSMGYEIQTEFEIEFPDKSKAKCIALNPPEKIKPNMPWFSGIVDIPEATDLYHLPPEIFISDGTPDSIVGKWVSERNGIGGLHHIAFQTDDVDREMKEWIDKGYAEFTTDEPLKCPGITQCFTKPSELTGVIFEFINRGEHGFCEDNVKDLMLSTADQ